MSIIALGRWRTWRRLLSCLVAYVFVLQLVLFGLATAHAVSLAADQDVVSAALCLHDQDAPIAPTGNSGAQEHCKFCTAAAHTVFAPPAITCHLVTGLVEPAAQRAGDTFVARPIPHTTPQPRGPPRTA